MDKKNFITKIRCYHIKHEQDLVLINNNGIHNRHIELHMRKISASTEELSSLATMLKYHTPIKSSIYRYIMNIIHDQKSIWPIQTHIYAIPYSDLHHAQRSGDLGVEVLTVIGEEAKDWLPQPSNAILYSDLRHAKRPALVEKEPFIRSCQDY
jgi:hypothetical protein